MGRTTDTVDRFVGRVADYAQFRPRYPDAVIDVLKVAWPLNEQWTVADIGCGTGISSELFLRAGLGVIGIEPNLEMRKTAIHGLKAYDRFQCLDGRAESTGLENRSIDMVAVAQAFHWFDVGASRTEFIRILRPPGRTALLWNTLRTDTPFLSDYEDLLRQFGTDYSAVHHKNLDEEVFRKFFSRRWSYSCIQHSQELDWNALQGRLRSSSFMPDASHPQFQSMMASLREIFDRHQQDGLVRHDYDTEIYYGEISPI